MNKIPVNRFLVVLTLLLVVASAPAAVLTNNLSFALTCVRQGEPASTNSETIVKFRVTTREVIGIIGLATSQTFPSGSGLRAVLVDPTNPTNPPLVYITGKSGVVLADVSSFFTFEFGNSVRQSKSTTASQATSVASYYILRVTFDDGHGNNFDLSGAASENYRASVSNSGGARKESGTISCDAAGPGASHQIFTVYKGKIKLSGSDTL
jgi:hypothetical protein